MKRSVLLLALAVGLACFLGSAVLGSVRTSSPELGTSQGAASVWEEIRSLGRRLLSHKHDGSDGSSVINASTLSTSSGIAITGSPSGTPAANTLYKDSLIKAWVNMNGTGTIAIQDSFNVSGITDNTTGSYTVTWDRDFANANYAVVFGANINGDFVLPNCTGVSVGAVGVRCRRIDSLTDTDTSYLTMVAVGDQ